MVLAKAAGADSDKMTINNNLDMGGQRMDGGEGTILAVEDLGKTVTTGDGALTILSGIDFAIKRGESVAVVGVSGSGKSTLLSLLAGLDLPSRGTVALCGHALHQLDEDGRARVRGAHVGFVFQSFQLLPNLTALENTLLPMEVLGHGDAEPAAHALLERVGLGKRLNHYPRQQSGGEHQRVAIARAFISGPKILFTLVPSGNQYAATGEQVIDLLLEIHHQRNTPLVLVPHDTSLAQRRQRRLELHAAALVTQLCPLQPRATS